MAEPPHALRFEQIGVEQGLAQESATAILQDRQGFMWIGSQAGLARYDGNRFVVFRNKPDDALSLSDNWVTALSEDGDGRLWIGTRGGGVLGHDPAHGTFQRFTPQDSARRGIGDLQIRAMFDDGTPTGAAGSHALWIATADGLEHLDTRSGVFEVWHHQTDHADSLASDDVKSLALDHQGRLWVGTAAGLDRLRPDGHAFEHFRVDASAGLDAEPSAVTALRVDSRNALWIGTSTGLQAWNLGADAPVRRIFGTRNGLLPNQVQAILEDRDGAVWIGTLSAGLLRWDAQNDRFVSYRHQDRDLHSLVDDDIDSLFQDRSGTLWVGTHDYGISWIDLASGGFERFVDTGGALGTRDDDKVYAVATDRAGHLWAGTAGGGLLRTDRSGGQFTAFRHDPADPGSLPDDVVHAVYVDSDDQVWAGTVSGLARLDPKTQRFRIRHFSDHDPSQDAIRQIVPGKSGVLWIGTEGALHRYDPATDSARTFRHDPEDPSSLSQGRVLAVLEDRLGTLWVGTDGGLDRWDAGSGRFTHFRHDPAKSDSLVHNRIHYLYEDHAGHLWIGTAGGLDRLDKDADGTLHFRAYTQKDGLGADPIGAVLEDPTGRLWISTTAGISRFDPATGRFRNYSERDGLLDGSYYVGSAHVSSDGVFYFGGFSGLTAFRPDAIHDNPMPPPVTITELQIFNRPVDDQHKPDGVQFDGTIDATRSLRLSHANTVFSLEFAALHYADPSRNRYAYQLVGFDPDWIQTDASRHFATYTNLDPGHYTFRVKASNKDGIWNENGASLDIIIDPPFWATWWFRALAAAALLGSLYAFIRFRVRGLTRQRVLLEEEVRARTAEVVKQKEDIELSHNTLSVLGEIGREITAKLDQSAILQTLDRHVHDLLDATTFAVYLLDADGRGLTSALRMEGGAALPVSRIELANPIANTARCARERNELHIELKPGEITLNLAPGTVQTLSLLFAPLAIGERLLGVMTIQSAQQHAYGQRERLVFRSLCAYGAIALDNATAYRRLAESDAEVQRILREQQAWLEHEVNARTIEVMQQKEDIEQAHSTLSVLGEIGREITAVLDQAEVCRTLDRHVHDLLDATTFAIFLLDPDSRGVTSVLRMEAGEDLPLCRYALDNPNSNTARCARERSELHIELDPDEFDPTHTQGTLHTLSLLFAPLAIGGRLLGVMTIQSPRQHVYGERERLVFRTLCAYGAIALDNAAAYLRLAEADAEVQRMLRGQQAFLEQEVRARTAEVVKQKEDIEQAHSTLSVLGEIGRKVTASLDQSAILQTLDRHVHELLDATTFVVYLLDADGRGLTTALHVEDGAALPVHHVDLNSPIANTARCARERGELHIEFGKDEISPNHLPGTLRSLSMLFAPLAIGDRLLGVMTIQSPQEHAYGERERLVFRTLCAYGAIALDNAAAYLRLGEADAEVQRMLREQQAWLEQEVSARTAEVLQQKEDIEQAHSTLSVLGEIGREITAVLDEAEVCRALDRHVHGLLDATAFGVFLFDAESRNLTSTLRVESGRDLPVHVYALDDSPTSTARCARERREVLLEFDPNDADPNHAPGTLRTLSCLFAPMTIGDRLLGVMTIQSPREHAYGEHERLIFRTLCSYGAIALDNAAAYRRLAEADAEVQRVLREQQAFLEQEVRARTAEVVKQKEDIEQAHSTLSVLGEIGREITAELDESAVCKTLDRHVHGLLDTESFGIYLLDADAQILTSVLFIEHGRELAEERIDLTSSTRHAARCARERGELLLDWAPNEEDASQIPGTLSTLSALFAPLTVGERLLGVMTIQSSRRQAYGERERLVFRTLCAYGAIALDNAAAYRHLAEADATLQRLLREQQAIYDNAAAAIFFIKGRIIHRCNRAMEEMLGYAPGELIGQSTEVYHPTYESWDSQGKLVYPLISTGKVAEGEWEVMRKNGELFWISFRGRALDPQDVQLGSIWVASDITERKRNETALVEANDRLERGLEEVEQLNRKVSLLGELTGFLQACPSAGEAFACICEFGPRLFPDSKGALYLSETSDAWVEQGHWGSAESEASTPAQSFLGSECWALRRSRPYRVDAPSGALCCAHVAVRDSQRHPYFCLPLTAQGKTFGVLFIEHHQIQSGAEADRRYGLAVAMAEQIALAIANVQLREALLQQSIRDPLTGLYNRRHLQEVLFREMAHSKRNHTTFAVMMIDVDHFKKFNDTFGHHAGDVVLQNVARTIEARFRRSDVTCRFGGEEFTVLLPGTSIELAQRLANGALEGIRDLVLSHENRPLDRVTASLGIALFPDHGSTPQALIEAADAALYRAKEAGRNRVMVSGPATS